MCSPSSGARRAGTLATPCTWRGLLIVNLRFPPAPSSGTTMSFALSCGSLITSLGARTAPKVRWSLLEDLAPMRHRLRGKGLIEDRGELRHVRRLLCRVGKPGIRQEIRAANRLGQRRPLVGRQHDHKPGVISRPIDVEGRVRRVRAIVQRDRMWRRKAPPGPRQPRPRRRQRAARS